MKMFTGIRRLLIGLHLALFCLAGTVYAGLDGEPAVSVSVSPHFGPRILEAQTKSAIIRDYLKSWHSMSRAFQQNDASALDASFTGMAKEKLTRTISEQRKAGIATTYRDRSHDIKFVFYSPEGLSLEIVDNVEYDIEMSAHGETRGTKNIKARYVAVLSPTEVDWKVRVMQAEEDNDNAGKGD